MKLQNPTSRGDKDYLLTPEGKSLYNAARHLTGPKEWRRRRVKLRNMFRRDPKTLSTYVDIKLEQVINGNGRKWLIKKLLGY